MDKDNERILLANVIGECIKSLQLDKNINQKELALLSGVSERSLRRIERGQVQAVSCSILIQYNFTQTKRPEVRKNRDFRSFFRTIPQAVIRPSTMVFFYGNNSIIVTKPQAVIRPSTLWLAHGSQSGLKALQWKIETLFIAKTAKLLTRAVLLRLRQKQNALGASLTAFWQTVCLL